MSKEFDGACRTMYANRVSRCQWLTVPKYSLKLMNPDNTAQGE